MSSLGIDSQVWEALIRCKRLFIGYSGGLDSTVLLHWLAMQTEFISKLRPIHINHGLSPHAHAWQVHCQSFCERLNLDLYTEFIQTRRDANIEGAAREARYRAFQSHIEREDGLLLAHHLNDQAETMFLHLIRGTGLSGLAAMAPSKPFGQGLLFRPLLHHSRTTLLAYANTHQLTWVEDESNVDTRFSRNYLRHEIVPRLVSRWPQCIHPISQTSEHCREAEENLMALAKIDCPEIDNAPSQLMITPSLKGLPQARRKNVLACWLKINHVRRPGALTFKRLMVDVMQAASDANPVFSWGDACIQRYQETLYLSKKAQNFYEDEVPWTNFPNDMPLGQLGILRAKGSDQGLHIPLASSIYIRFRKGGEAMVLRGQTKRLKKLFQEWQVPPWLREKIPLIYINNVLAAVVGYATSDLFYKANSAEVYNISIVGDNPLALYNVDS